MILLILILFFQSTTVNVYALDEQTYYARILFDQVYFYKSAIDDNSASNIYFELPKSYFVKLTNKHGNFYEATYQNLTGYVKKDSVQAVANTPSNPFLNNITFRVYAEPSEKIYSQPKSTSALITQIPPLTKNIQYIGKIDGERLIDGRTNIWYYCKFSADFDYYGYVYSDFCDEMPQIPINNEDLKYISNPTFEIASEQVNAIPKDSNLVGIVIGILSIPALVFVLMIMKGTKLISQEKVKRKEIVDY